MRLDIFSDTICPWCYIGKRRLEKALQAHPRVDLQITWRAFQLNPDMPAEGIDRKFYLENKFGGPEGAKQVYGNIARTGAEEGIDFQFDRIERTPNTIASHRLIRYATLKGHQDDLIQKLFDAYFKQGQNIGDHEVLADVATTIGLDKQETLTFLKSDQLEEEIRAEDQQARQIGINGVPCFIFNGRHALPGAQVPEALNQLMDLAQEEERA
ncbi:DsbA family oxidoreductase [Rhodovibrionaceae bacterium A322]